MSAPRLDAASIHLWLLPGATPERRLSGLLAQYLGCPPALIALQRGPHGKPQLVGEPLHFNLSHSGALALLAIARDVAVGVDVERVDRPIPRQDALLTRCFTAAEAAFIVGQDQP